MPADTPYQLSNAVWNVILDRIGIDDLPIHYGDLSQIFYGHVLGGKAFAGPLGNIHQNVAQYNKNHSLRGAKKIPFLNELVIRADTNRPGRGAPGNPEPIITLVEKVKEIPLNEWKRIGYEIGYKPDIGYKKYAPKGKTNKSFHGTDLGPSEGGTRSEVVWEAKQNPIAKSLAAELASLGWNPVKTDHSAYRPDLLFRNDSKKQTILIEVKPDDDLHSLITGFGQCLVYNSAIKADIVALAAPAKLAKGSLLHFFKAHGIRLIDVSSSLKQQIQMVVG